MLSRVFRRALTKVPAARAVPRSFRPLSGIATDEEQATGREREEMEAVAAGEERFSLDPIEGKFGTYDHPVMVKSGVGSRIVGCTGGVEGGDKYHDVLWFNLDVGMPHMCGQCGQIFSLDQIEVHGHH